MTGQENKPLTAIIVDDEFLARAYLKEMLRAHPQIQIVGECANGFDAVQAVVEKRPNLLFLDIQMPKLSGFEVLEALEPDLPRVIFITAFDEYALKAFEVHAVDYLLKPFSKDRLAMAVDRVLTDPFVPMPTARQIVAGTGPLGPEPARIVIRDGGTVIVVSTEDIDYITAEGDYVLIHVGGQTHLKLDTISAMTQRLSQGSFVRIHRSVLLNVNRLDHVETSDTDSKEAVLKDKARLAVSRSGYKALMERLGS